jgi:hypothetical protein
MVKTPETEDEKEIEKRRKKRAKESNLIFSIAFMIFFAVFLVVATKRTTQIFENSDRKFENKIKNDIPKYRFNRTSNYPK